MELITSFAVNWNIVTCATPAWAEQVFPDEPERALARLWDAIFQASRVTVDDPVAAWAAHNETLHRRADWLNDRRFAALHFTGPGTDLTVGLADGHAWAGGSSPRATASCATPST